MQAAEIRPLDNLELDSLLPIFFQIKSISTYEKNEFSDLLLLMTYVAPLVMQSNLSAALKKEVISRLYECDEDIKRRNKWKIEDKKKQDARHKIYPNEFTKFTPEQIDSLIKETPRGFRTYSKYDDFLEDLSKRYGKTRKQMKYKLRYLKIMPICGYHYE